MIGESELILNADGSVYHLNLKPDEIAPVIITVGDPERVQQVSKFFDSVELRKQKREFVTHTGFIGRIPITVLSTGIGTDNIDIVLTELDALVNIDFTTREIKKQKQRLQIIRIGTSGALQPDIPVDTFLASRYAIGLDSLLNFYQFDYAPDEKELLLGFQQHMDKNHLAFLPYVAPASFDLLHTLAADYRQGITVTAPGFYGPQGRVLRNTPSFPNLLNHLSRFQYMEMQITNFEMETSGIYGMAKLMGHQALSLNLIVANRAGKQFSSTGDKMIEKLIEQTLIRLSVR